MSGQAKVQDSASHVLTRTWVAAALVCGKCDLAWEQPGYESEAHFVCPRCLHASIPKVVACSKCDDTGWCCADQPDPHRCRCGAMPAEETR